jgi:hypothetical protein
LLAQKCCLIASKRKCFWAGKCTIAVPHTLPFLCRQTRC